MQPEGVAPEEDEDEDSEGHISIIPDHEHASNPKYGKYCLRFVLLIVNYLLIYLFIIDSFFRAQRLALEEEQDHDLPGPSTRRDHESLSSASQCVFVCSLNCELINYRL